MNAYHTHNHHQHHYYHYYYNYYRYYYHHHYYHYYYYYYYYYYYRVLVHSLPTTGKKPELGPYMLCDMVEVRRRRHEEGVCARNHVVLPFPSPPSLFFFLLL